MYGATFITMQQTWRKDNYFYGYAGNMMETDSKSEVYFLLKENVLSPRNMVTADYGRFEYSIWYCGVSRNCYCDNGGILHIVET